MILALGYWATNTFLGDEYPILWGNIPIVVSLFVGGWIGVVSFARREMPWAARRFRVAAMGLIACFRRAWWRWGGRVRE